MAALLLIHVGLCGQTAWVKTVTHDEIWHLPVGVRNLREGNFAVERLNPPLSRIWAALPLVIAGVDVDRTVDGPGAGNRFVSDHPRDFQRWYFLGRLFNIIWSLGTGLLLYAWSSRMFGPSAALLTLLLYVCCPNIIAHSSLVTPDAGLMFGFVATLFALSRWTDRPGWGRAVLLGTMLGVAMAMKFTAVLLPPLVVLLATIRFWRRAGTTAVNRKGTEKVRRGVIAGQFCLAMFVSLLVLGGAFGFQGMFQSLGGLRFQSSELRTIQELFAVVKWLPLPLPGDFLLGLDEQRAIMEGAHPVFLDGQWSVSGFRSYYLRTLFYKLPHHTQLLILVAVVAAVSQRLRLRTGSSGDWLALWLPVVMLVGVASFSGMQLGVRYVLPVLPLLLMTAGSAAVVAETWPSRVRSVAALVLIVLCGFALRFHPHHLAYFNGLAGGPTGGRFHLLDSNLDWGQDLGLVKAYVEEQQLDSIGLAYFGTLDPRVLGIEYRVPPSWNPEPGWYAVSVNYVMGRPHVIPHPDGNWRGTDFQEFGYFRFYAPVTTLGGSIDIYELTQHDVDRWPRPRP